MIVSLLIETHTYSIPVVLLGCLLEAGLIIWLIITLDYRTWSKPKPIERQIRRQRKQEKKWRGQAAHTGAMRFALMMMLLVMGLAFVMIVDVISG